MSAGMTYGQDPNTAGVPNGGGHEYAAVTFMNPPNGQHIAYPPPQGQHAQSGQPSGGLPLVQQVPPHSTPSSSGYIAAGEPSMRKTVEGIPQVHFSGHQQQRFGGSGGTAALPTSVQSNSGAMAMGPPHAPGVQLMHHHYRIPSSGSQPAQPYPAPAIPVQFYQTSGAAAYNTHPPGAMAFPHMSATHVADYRFGGPQFVVDPSWHMGGGEWDEELEDTSGVVLYGNLEVRSRYCIASNSAQVKHRRRTTPEQLRVLEHWFAINPRPDNALREWLASELGITKRNVQVWFQNRRAKIKNQEKAREAAAKEAKSKEVAATSAPNLNSETVAPPSDSQDTTGKPALPSAHPNIGPDGPPSSAQSTPTRPSSSSGVKPSPLMLDADKVNMGRRISLAGGDVASVEVWAKQRKQQLMTSTSVGNSPMGLAAAARRNSQPYPTQSSIHADDLVSRSALPSPKVSPNGRMPQALLFTAMRNNTLRRASMPGGAQLISTTTFTPPRLGSLHAVSGGTSVNPSQPRELSPIRDQDSEIDPALRGPTGVGVYITPPGVDQSLLVPQTEAGMQYALNPGIPFTPNSPLPNPSFSFGGTPSGPLSQPESCHVSLVSTPVSDPKHDPQHALFMALQRGRLGSIASVNSVTTNATDASSTTVDGSDQEWPPTLIPPGFDPDIRRASAPADLLHNIGLLGISSGGPSQAMSASSSNNSSTPQSAQAMMSNRQYAHYDQTSQLQGAGPGIAGGPYIPSTDGSPSTVTGSAAPSEGPSPAGVHSHVNSTSHSSGTALMPPPPVPQWQQYTTYADLPHEFGDEFGSSSLPPPSLPEPSPYTTGAPGEGNASGTELDFAFGANGFKDQYFTADLLGDDAAHVLI